MLDTYYMDMALRKAEEAAELGETPIGAVLVMGDKIYSESGNLRETRQSPIAHAEILAITHASESIQSWRLLNSTLYVTVEPCLMCAGAIYLSRIPRVVFGCRNPKGGVMEYVSTHENTFNLNHHVEVVAGVRELESARLLKTFFKKLRERNEANVE